MDSGTMDTRDSNISTSDCHCSISGNTQDLGQAWQLGDPAVLLSGPDFIPSSTPLRNEEWMEPAQPRSSAPHWVLPAAWAPEAAAADAAAADSAGGWTISTASVVQHSHYSAEHAAMGVSVGAAATLDCSSDPLTCTAQLMLAAAAPRVHCVPDSGALLNSGAVLLLGQGSTTMCGTNTAQEMGSAASGHFLNPEDPHSHVLSTPQHSMQDLHPQQLPMPAQQQQQAAPTAAAGRAARRRTRSRRRQGLLVDSELGLQQLVAAAAAGHQQDPQDLDTRHHRPSAAQDHNTSRREQQQQQQCNQCHAHQSTAGCVGESDHRVPSGHRASNRQQAPRRSTSAVSCTSAPASADVLVLGGSSAGVHAAPAAPAAPPAGSAQAQAGAAGAQQQHTSAQEARAASDARTAEPQAASILQLLSCDSLADNPPAGRSNSSLLHLSLSNCSVLRLGSFTLRESSFSSSQDSSAAQSRTASFCNQQHTANGHAAAAAGAAVGWSVHSPVGGTVPLGPTSRPSPLPMLHESRSWGQNLDAADRVGDVQRRHSVHSMHVHTEASSQAQQQQQALKQHAQLIYLLD